MKSQKSTMERGIRFLLCHRALVLLVLLLITLLALWQTRHAVLSTDMGRLFFGHSEKFHTWLERVRQFGSDEVFVVGIEDVDILAPKTLDQLEKAVAEIEALGVRITNEAQPGVPRPSDHQDDDEFAGFDDDETNATQEQVFGVVRTVTSVLSAQRVRAVDGGLEIRSFAELARAHPEKKEELLEEFRKDELSGGILVSPNGRHLALVIELIPNTDRAARGERSAEDGPMLVEKIKNAVSAAGFAPERIHMTGFPAVMAEMIVLTKDNIQRIFPITVIILLLSVYLLFRRLWPALLGLIVAMLGVIWTMGLAVTLDPAISIMHSIAPMVITIVASSDVIHLCSAYLMELDTGKNKEEAIVAAASDVGYACLYTSMTTFTGFLGLSFVPTPVFRLLGVILGAGVAFSLLIAVILVPVLLTFIKTPTDWRSGSTSVAQDGLDHFLFYTSKLATEKAPWILCAFALVFAAAVAGLSRLEVETSMTDRLASDNQVAMDREWFEAHFASANFLDVYVHTSEPQGLLKPEVIHGLAALQDKIKASPGVDTARSVVDVYEVVHEQLAGPAAAERLPQTKEAFAQYNLLVELSDRELLGRLSDFQQQIGRLSVRMSDEAVRAVYRKANEIERLAPQYLPDSVKVESTGILYLTGEWLGQILEGQRRGLGFTILIISLMMMICLGSIRIGLWSMVPNLLPLLFLGGYLGLSRDTTDSDMLILAMLAIGIGVDDTIHFMMRYRIEAGRSTDRTLALKRTFDFAGRGIVMTTVVLSLGFLPFTLSDYSSTYAFGTLLPMTLVLALVADLLLVPALAQVGALSFPTASEREEDVPVV